MTVSTEYTPTYWNEQWPDADGIFAKIINQRYSKMERRLAAVKMLQFMKDAGPDQYGSLVGVKTPVPMLIKVPDSNMVRFITGLAPFIADPLQHASPLDGKLLAIQQDIDDPTETPNIILLPSDLLKIQRVQAHSQDNMITELEKERIDKGTPWFKEHEVKTSFVETSRAAPCPPDLAWDAFSEDVPAHIILERVLSAEPSLVDSGDKALFFYLKDFLSAAQVAHNVGSNTLDLGSRTFTQSLPKAANGFHLWPHRPRSQVPSQTISHHRSSHVP